MNSNLMMKYKMYFENLIKMKQRTNSKGTERNIKKILKFSRFQNPSLMPPFHVFLCKNFINIAMNMMLDIVKKALETKFRWKTMIITKNKTGKSGRK